MHTIKPLPGNKNKYIFNDPNKFLIQFLFKGHLRSTLEEQFYYYRSDGPAVVNKITNKKSWWGKHKYLNEESYWNY